MYSIIYYFGKLKFEIFLLSIQILVLKIYFISNLKKQCNKEKTFM